MNKYFKEELLEIAKSNTEKYKNAQPFPHISFDNLLDTDILNTVLDEFPNLSKKDAISYNTSKEKKFAGKGELFFDNKTKELMYFLNSEYFLNFLQVLTGIKEPLFGDPYYIGGGQHEIKRGGLLKIHADFNKHPISNLDRRINVLIYLNKEWKEEYGGHLELWDKNIEVCKGKILPKFNTMTIFSTTDFSYHGHPNALNCPEDMSRKSLALYYYSNGRPSDEINLNDEKNNTLFKARKYNPDDKVAFSKNVQISLKSIIKNITPPILISLVKLVANKRSNN